MNTNELENSIMVDKIIKKSNAAKRCLVIDANGTDLYPHRFKCRYNGINI